MSELRGWGGALRRGMYVAFALGVLLLGNAGSAHAQRRQVAPDADDSDEAPGGDALARVEFERGRDAFERHDYPTALAAFERAYELSARPQLLYNIAQSADRLRRDARALEAFEQFLAALPDTPLRASVEERIAVLRAALASRGDAPRETSTQPATPSAPPAERSVLAPVLVLSIGGALAVGGAVSLALGVADRDSVEGAAPGTTLASVEGAADRAPLLMNGGIALLAVGLAAAGAGLVWLLLPASDDATDASLAIAPTASGVLVTGAF